MTISRVSLPLRQAVEKQPSGGFIISNRWLKQSQLNPDKFPSNIILGVKSFALEDSEECI